MSTGENPAPANGIIDVAAAALLRAGRVLLARRAGGTLRGHWEFPGGKIAAGESPAVALARELVEELELHLAIGRALGCHEYRAPGMPVIRLHFFAVAFPDGDVRLRVHDAVAWVDETNWQAYRLAPADVAFARSFIVADNLRPARP